MDQELQSGSSTESQPIGYKPWSPQPGPQLAAIEADWCYEILYGGARGGGKSIFLLLDFLKDVKKYGAAWQGILVRKTYPELDQIIADSWRIFAGTGAIYHKQPKTWFWPNGASLKFRNLATPEDCQAYQGHSYSFLAIDEMGNYSDPTVFQMMLATVRSGYANINTRVRCTANPGGQGHHWLKSRYIDPHPLGYTPFKDSPTSTRERMYIPSRITDNKILLQNDKYYIENLRSQASPELVRAWLEGDWDVQLSSFFPDFDKTKHVVRPFIIPSHWYRFRSFDWGHADPFACIFVAVADGTTVLCDDGMQLTPPKGSLIIYREVYGMEPNRPNVGVRWTNEQICHAILKATGNDKISCTVTDNLPFQNRGGPTIAEIFARNGLLLQFGNTDRITGWSQLHSRLVGNERGPLLYIFDNCVHLIRTLPQLQHDKHKMEDVADGYEDHICDCLRLACTHRSIVRTPVEEKPFHGRLTFNELIKLDELESEDD